MADIEVDASNISCNKVIYLIRHAQAMHNLKYKNHSMPDPILTPKGIRQCEELFDTFPAKEADSIELLVTSPLRRAIYTVSHAFPTAVKRGTTIIALPEAQENGSGLKPCDTGSDRSILESEFKDLLPLDLGLVVDGWNATTDQAADPDTLRARGLLVRRWLKNRSEKVIALVSHGGFLHYLSENWDGFNEKRGTAWENCEYRAYRFKVPVNQKDDDATLIELQNSKDRRNTTG